MPGDNVPSSNYSLLITESGLENLQWSAHLLPSPGAKWREREKGGGGPVIWLRNTTVTKIVMILDSSS